MSADDDSSELSSLSSLSPAPSDDDLSDLGESEEKPGILKFFSKLSEQPAKEPSPPPRKRSPSPPHEYVLADNPDIAFIVMFRSRFSDAFPKSLAHFGPQELERDVVAQIPGDRVEYFLCAVLGLLLNRKQDVKPGHYGRALEDAITSHKSQWARAWEDKSPLSGGATFNTMTPTERLTLLRTLILWAMASSDALKALINQSYKQNRHEDDLNQPRSVQPWGSDADKRRYYLVEGQDDTNFRVYRESNPQGTSRTWWSVAGSIEELKELVEKLEKKDGGPKAKKLGQKIASALPRFEAGEEKRRRRDYRQMQKERFKRPEPGFSLYEGRTRGKRIKYTYSDDEDIFYSDSTTRRSARNTGTHTPAETGPVTTSSGRQIRAPPRLNAGEVDSAVGSVNGDGADDGRESSFGPTGRPRRSAAANHGTNGWTGSEPRSRRNTSMDSDEEESEVDFGDDEEDAEAQVPEESEDEDEFDEDEAMVDDDLDDQPRSLMVKLSVTPPKLRHALTPVEDSVVNASPTPKIQDEKPVNGMVHENVVEMADAPAAAASEVKELSPPKSVLVAATGNGSISTHDAKPALTEGAISEQANEIKVASVVKEKTPEPTNGTEPKVESVLTATPLAFRGSPEKPVASAVPQPGAVNGGE